MSTKETNSASGLPLRGIAMIILAVAVLLLAWGVYSLTNTGSEEAVVSQKSDTQQTAPTQKQPPAAAQQPASGAASTTAAATPSPTPSTPAAAPAANAAAGPAPKVQALNNSTVQGLANRVADELKKQGYSDIESGNFPNEVLPKSVAFFTPGNAAEEQAARNIADKLGVTAQPRIDALKDKPAGVILVITEDLNR
ncbi:LytR C-terminal domain-containing protein [Corynebacterium sp. H127]|uniref:LytR C-terminal domain-containing protein n=1 Tax=Corynebacterium sp. H127 TaxID=3133418 RepID=UPI0030AAE68B